MQVDGKDKFKAPAATGIFALVVGADLHVSTTDDLIAAFRRMGLRPERISDATQVRSAEALVGVPAVRLRFGRLSVLAGWSTPQAIAEADPLDDACSSIAGPFPDQWQAGKQCLTFIPLMETGDGADWDHEQTRLREFFKMMVLLIDLFDASHLFWSPARLWSDADHIRSAIAEMVVSGMPPVLHLVAFRIQSRAEGNVMITRGLDHFVAQELSAIIPASWSSAGAVKRLARIALDMMINGPITAPRRIKGLDQGEWVFITPPEKKQAEGAGPVRVEFRQSD